jgi:HSP20 family protein
MKLVKRQNQSGSALAERGERGMDRWGRTWPLRDMLDRMFADHFLAPFAATERLIEEISPRIDVQERNNQFIIKADVPGVEEDKLDLEIAENRVYISGRIEREEEKGAGSTYRREREEGEFRREVFLPAKVDPNSVQATLRNGLLTITLNKEKGEERKKIEIKKG